MTAVLALLAGACSGLIGVADIHLDPSAIPPGGEGGTGEGGDTDGPTNGGEGGTDAPVTCTADLMTDLQNCGKCGHDCTSGICDTGICILAQDLTSPSSITVRKSVYIATLGGLSGGTILSCPTSGCANATVGTKLLSVDGGDLFPWHVVATDTHVFASDYLGTNKGGLWRVLTTGGDLRKVPPGVNQMRGYGSAIDNNSVYWVTNDAPGGISYCSLPDCPSIQTARSTTMNGELIAVASNGTLVWSENSGGILNRCTSKTACTPSLLVPDYQGLVNDLTIDGNVAYWGTNLGEIFSCSIAGCANVTKLVLEAPKATIGAIAVSGTQLFWSSMEFQADGNNVKETEGKIKTCTIGKCTGADVRVIATNQHDPSAMALDPNSVYWSNSGKRGYSDGIGNVLKAAR